MGRLVVTALLKSEGFKVKPSGHRISVNGNPIPVRFSTGWAVGGFKFEQLRFGNYSAVFCLGITPNTAYAWAVPITAIFDQDGQLHPRPGLTGQHKGKAASDTAWITVDLASVPAWMGPYGGSISDAIKSLKKLIP
jgi:hypothetical protein